MKIATYNVNGINARLPVLTRWLKETGPDVVCLQELEALGDKIPLKAVEDETGYTGIWHGQKSWNGVAILSKDHVIEEVNRDLPGDSADEQSRYIEAIVNNIHIACLYLPNGNPAPGPKYDYKMQWMKRLTQHTANLLEMKKPVVLAGDFNVIPTGNDVYKPERWVNDALFRTETREAFFNILDQGWTDSIRKIYPTEIIYTFWDFFRNAYERNAGLRIDHLLLNPQLENRLVNAGVDKDVRGWERSSDHAPVWIEISD